MNSLFSKNIQTRLTHIVGLGNIGVRYDNSRHNIGFNFVDALRSTLENDFYLISETIDKNEYTSYFFRSIGLNLLKPKLLMNRSGDSLVEYLKYKKLNDYKEMLVVHDDLDIALGKYKLQLSKSPKAHNGIISIELALKTTEFFRLRIGIDNREDRTIPASNFVLMNMSKEERTSLDELITEIIHNELSIEV